MKTAPQASLSRYKSPSRPTPRGALLSAAVWLLVAATVHAQQPSVSYLHAGATAPGVVGGMQLMQPNKGLQGYFQPIDIHAPAGAAISLAIDNQFSYPELAPVKAGMLIGAVYRLRVINIPDHEGVELFPTIEVTDRLYPPPGAAARFAVPVELSQEELEFAIAGKFVTRVIYVENPQAALPVVDDAQRQMVYEVGPRENPVEVADRLGRPIAILRIGGRTPNDTTGPDAHFMYNSPPLTRYYRPEVSVQPVAPPERLPSVQTARRQPAATTNTRQAGYAPQAAQ